MSVTEQAKSERRHRMALGGDDAAISDDRLVLGAARPTQGWDRPGGMRWLGLGLCILSAAFTVLSAVLIAARL
jgi:hypothetical protein